MKKIVISMLIAIAVLCMNVHPVIAQFVVPEPEVSAPFVFENSTPEHNLDLLSDFAGKQLYCTSYVNDDQVDLTTSECSALAMRITPGQSVGKVDVCYSISELLITVNGVVNFEDDEHVDCVLTQYFGE